MSGCSERCYNKKSRCAKCNVSTFTQHRMVRARDVIEALYEAMMPSDPEAGMCMLLGEGHLIAYQLWRRR